QGCVRTLPLRPVALTDLGDGGCLDGEVELEASVPVPDAAARPSRGRVQLARPAAATRGLLAAASSKRPAAHEVLRPAGRIERDLEVPGVAQGDERPR